MAIILQRYATHEASKHQRLLVLNAHLHKKASALISTMVKVNAVVVCLPALG